MDSAPAIHVTSCLADVLALALAQHPALADRLASAARVLDDHLDTQVFPPLARGPAGWPAGSTFWVAAEAQPGAWYLVNIKRAGRCTCPACAADDGPCAHILAVRLLKAACHLRHARQRAAEAAQALPAGYAAMVAALVV